MDGPLGSANTVLYTCYHAYGIRPSKTIAGLMLSGLLSDTVGLRSSTTTAVDRKAVEELSVLAGINVAEFTRKLLAVKVDVNRLSDIELLNRDGKCYTFGGKKLWIAVIETDDPKKLQARLPSLKAKMSEFRKEKQFDAVFLAIMNIAQGETAMFVDAQDTDLAKKIWNIPVTSYGQRLVGVTSRKKQIVPILQRYFGD